MHPRHTVHWVGEPKGDGRCSQGEGEGEAEGEAEGEGFKAVQAAALENQTYSACVAQLSHKQLFSRLQADVFKNILEHSMSNCPHACVAVG